MHTASDVQLLARVAQGWAGPRKRPYRVVRFKQEASWPASRSFCQRVEHEEDEPPASRGDVDGLRKRSRFAKSIEVPAVRKSPSRSQE